MKKHGKLLIILLAIIILAVVLILLINKDFKVVYKGEKVPSVTRSFYQSDFLGGQLSDGIRPTTYVIPWEQPDFIINTYGSIVNGDLLFDKNTDESYFGRIDNTQPAMLNSNYFDVGPMSIRVMFAWDYVVNYNVIPQVRQADTAEQLDSAEWVISPTCTTKQFFQYRLYIEDPNVTSFPLENLNLYFLTSRAQLVVHIVDSETEEPINVDSIDLGTETIWTETHSSAQMDTGLYSLDIYRSQVPDYVDILVKKTGYQDAIGSAEIVCCDKYDIALIFDVFVDLAKTPVVEPTPEPTISPTPEPTSEITPTPTPTPSSTIKYTPTSTTKDNSATLKSSKPISSTFKATTKSTTIAPTTSNDNQVTKPQIVRLNKYTQSEITKCLTSTCEDNNLLGFVQNEYITFTGTTSPNNIVKLHIYSDPIEVQTTSDSTGKWTYILTQELSPGTHYVEAETIDSNGTSSGLVKIANFNVTKENFDQDSSNKTNYIIAGIVAGIIVLIIALVLILAQSQKKKAGRV